MEHRWLAVQPVEQGGGGFTIRGYAKALDVNERTVRRYVRGAELHRAAGASRTPLDSYETRRDGRDEGSCCGDRREVDPALTLSNKWGRGAAKAPFGASTMSCHVM